MKKSLCFLFVVLFMMYGCVLEEKLVAHWTFDEDVETTVFDISSNENHGKIIVDSGGEDYQWVYGNIFSYGYGWGNGPIGSALFLDDNACVYVDYNRSFNANVFTVAAWLNCNNEGNEAAYLRRYNGWSLITKNNEWCIKIDNTNGGEVIQSGHQFAIDEWHHYAVVVNNTSRTVIFYVDGEKFGDTKTYSKPFASSLESDIYIGQFDSTHRWSGGLDDVRFYRTALESQLIQDLYALGN